MTFILCVFIGGLIGFSASTIHQIVRTRRELGKKKFACKILGHAKPVYHTSRAFWWCERCEITLGINQDLWTPEAIAEHSEMMRRPDRN